MTTLSPMHGWARPLLSIVDGSAAVSDGMEALAAISGEPVAGDDNWAYKLLYGVSPKERLRQTKYPYMAIGLAAACEWLAHSARADIDTLQLFHARNWRRLADWADKEKYHAMRWFLSTDAGPLEECVAIGMRLRAVGVTQELVAAVYGKPLPRPAARRPTRTVLAFVEDYKVAAHNKTTTGVSRLIADAITYRGRLALLEADSTAPANLRAIARVGMQADMDVLRATNAIACKLTAARLQVPTDPADIRPIHLLANAALVESFVVHRAAAVVALSPYEDTEFRVTYTTNTVRNTADSTTVFYRFADTKTPLGVAELHYAFWLAAKHAYHAVVAAHGIVPPVAEMSMIVQNEYGDCAAAATDLPLVSRETNGSRAAITSYAQQYCLAHCAEECALRVVGNSPVARVALTALEIRVFFL